MGKVYLLFAVSIVSVFISLVYPHKIDNLDIRNIVGVYRTASKTESVHTLNKTVAQQKSLGALSTGDTVIDSYIVDACAKYNVDPMLILAQMKQESNFKQKATSHKGASGLMQLMPATAMRFGVKNIYDPQQNIDAGVKYMRWLLNKFDGNVNLALAGYNAGEGAVMKYGNQIPPYRETQGYVTKITAHYRQIKSSNLAFSIPGKNTVAQKVASFLM